MGSSPVTVTETSDFALAWSKEFLDNQATIDCGFTLKRVRDNDKNMQFLFNPYAFYLTYGHGYNILRHFDDLSNRS